MKQLLVRTEKCVGCKTCELECSVIHSKSKDLFTTVTNGEKPIRLISVENNSVRSMNLTIQCRQCREPKCVLACMTGAMYLDETTGLVLNDEAKCVGCWMCVMLCPFGVIIPDEQEKLAKKCDQCLSEGHDPACVKGCPTKALKFVPITEFSKDVKRDFLVRFVQNEEG